MFDLHLPYIEMFFVVDFKNINFCFPSTTVQDIDDAAASMCHGLKGRQYIDISEMIPPLTS